LITSSVHVDGRLRPEGVRQWLASITYVARPDVDAEATVAAYNELSPIEGSFTVFDYEMDAARVASALLQQDDFDRRIFHYAFPRDPCEDIGIALEKYDLEEGRVAKMMEERVAELVILYADRITMGSEAAQSKYTARMVPKEHEIRHLSDLNLAAFTSEVEAILGTDRPHTLEVAFNSVYDWRWSIGRGFVATRRFPCVLIPGDEIHRLFHVTPEVYSLLCSSETREAIVRVIDSHEEVRSEWSVEIAAEFYAAASAAAEAYLANLRAPLRIRTAIPRIVEILKAKMDASQ
jgi:hypothetical protein